MHVLRTDAFPMLICACAHSIRHCIHCTLWPYYSRCSHHSDRQRHGFQAINKPSGRNHFICMCIECKLFSAEPKIRVCTTIQQFYYRGPGLERAKNQQIQTLLLDQSCHFPVVENPQDHDIELQVATHAATFLTCNVACSKNMLAKICIDRQPD